MNMSLIYALRPTQWTKNTLVLAAFFFAFGDQGQARGLGLSELLISVCGMALFCVVSSAVYLFNDLHDLAQDRNHPRKRYRPIASGRVSTRTAIVTGVTLLVAGLGLSYALQPSFGHVTATYVLMQVLYTLALKRVALLDTFIIAIGFVMRALGGAVIIKVSISPWLLLCTFLLALFLGLCKRRHEKIELEDAGVASRESLSQYDQLLLDQLIAIVSAATIVSYAIYTLWPDTVEKFGTYRLGFTIPLVIFGIFRYLDLVYRHEKGDRPEKILLTDAPLLICIALYGAAVVLIFSL
ncbi:MAG: decaprenyl-phosphate phosphoribosyltransferase [Verrucomicrobia bacterium]|nr:decaprenyl-phosphate phosphoribosyltransferase [Verrucomicrobiota bacterium]MDA1085769.1 decaprenyl-phosphate phosphoribosyltransferase [Verrucomicrobiota bacterium]